MKYAEYITSPKWAATRAIAIAAAGYKCRVCLRRNELEVHHKTYERMGNEHPEDLLVACVRCHNDIHWVLRIVRPGERAVRQGTPVTEAVFNSEVDRAGRSPGGSILRGETT